MVYIEYSRSTRLGNWMFQYAVAKTLSKGAAVSFYVRPEYDNSHVESLLKHGNILKGISVVRRVPENCELISDKVDFRQWKRLVLDGNYLLKGVFQLPVLFDAEMVKSLYVIPDEIDLKIKDQYGGRLLNEESVCIHVRRGDYLRLPHRHPFVGEEYLRRAVSVFGMESMFYVCSDDIPWCKRFFTQNEFAGRRFAFVEGGTAVSDMYVTASCRHNIISNSTFGWWGAYLNPNPQKRVIMPSRWFGVSIGRRESDAAIKALWYPNCEVVKTGFELHMVITALLHAAKTKVGDVLRYFGWMRKMCV